MLMKQLILVKVVDVKPRALTLPDVLHFLIQLLLAIIATLIANAITLLLF